MTMTHEQKLARARAVAAECAPRVKARKDYASDNVHAVAFRKQEEREIGIRVMQAEAERFRQQAEADALSRRNVVRVAARLREVRS
jgi:hypothetical protein